VTTDDQPQKDLEGGAGSTPPRKKATPGNAGAKKITSGKQRLRDFYQAASGKEVAPSVLDEQFERAVQKWADVFVDEVVTDAMNIDVQRLREQQRAAEASDDDEEDD
jgi:hypothetical protein